MKIGTKSILFGGHQFSLHPLDGYGKRPSDQPKRRK